MSTLETPPALPVLASSTPASILGTTSPRDTLARAHEVADVVQAIVTASGFAHNLGGRRDHVSVDGWNALGSILGLGVKVDAVRPFTDAQGARGYEAVVRVVRGDETVAEAQAICTRGDHNFTRSPESALYSMAQTRAVGKAYRVALSWLMVLSGFEATPAEELAHERAEERAAAMDSTAAAARLTPAQAFGAWYRELDPVERDALKARLADLGVKPSTGAVADAFGEACRTPDAMLAELARRDEEREAAAVAQLERDLDATEEPEAEAVEADVVPPEAPAELPLADVTPPAPSAAVRNRRNRSTEETTDAA